MSAKSDIFDFFIFSLVAFYLCLLPDCPAKISNTILNEIGNSKQPYFLPDLRRQAFSFCH